MKHDLAQAWARLKGALHNPSKARKPGTCLVKCHDLELLLAEVQQLSNEQVARHIIKITLEALRNGDSQAESIAPRLAKRRSRRYRTVRDVDRASITGRAPALDGVFVFTDNGMEVLQ